jgi:hypothetical protein
MADRSKKPQASKGYVEKPSTVAAEPLIMETIPPELEQYLAPGGMDTPQKTIDARATVVRLAMTGKVNPKWIKIFNELGRDAATAHAARKANTLSDALAGFAGLARLACQAPTPPKAIEERDRIVLEPLDARSKEPAPVRSGADPFSEDEYDDEEPPQEGARRFVVDLHNVESPKPPTKAPPATMSLRDILRKGSP